MAVIGKSQRNSSVGFDTLDFAYFNAKGQWEPEVYTIDIAAITQIAFDTRYVNVFSKYLDAPCPF